MSLASRFKEKRLAQSAVACEDAALEEALHEVAARGAAAWPGIALPAEALASFLGERTPAGVPELEWLAAARAADLFLACACAEGLPAALRAFEASFAPQIALFLQRYRPSAERLADVTQDVLEKLFVGASGGPPRIRQYMGEGALGAWVRVVAVRAALDMMAAHKSDERSFDEVDAIASAVVPANGPEVELLEARHAGEFRAALREAMAELSLRERAILRFAFVEHVTPGQLGVMYGVHRTTVMRWMEAAEETVLARTRKRLMDRLGLSPSECDSLMAVLKSRIDITLRSLLDVPA